MTISVRLFPSKQILATCSCFAIAALLPACSGSERTSSIGADNSQEGGDDRGQPAISCAQLVHRKIPASAIGLPTTGAVVTAAVTVAAAGTGASAIGAFCLVSGSISPIDPAAPDIDFQLGLPTAWNRKMLMLGGGGFDGSIPPPSSNTPNGPVNAPVPLGRGYAVFASDSGHQDANAADGAFSVNQEAYLNFMGDALKKTRDAALFLVTAFYRRDVERSYFAGGSTGGRESLTVIQRWPKDWDGAIALYPAWDFTALTLGQLDATQAFAAPGAFLDTAKRGVLYSAALAACDALAVCPTLNSLP
jgi:feruloyl esterase